MKKLALIFLTFFGVLSLFSQTREFTVATYNLRFQNSRDSIRGNGWSDRLPTVVSLMQHWDIIGTQEGHHGQILDLETKLGYSFIGESCDGGKMGEYCAIFYKKDRFEVMDSETFWFSPRPEIPSYGKKTKHRRICTWGKFKIKDSDTYFYVFNMHLDHRVRSARLESLKQLTKKIEEIAGDDPVIVIGDFNFSQKTEEYRRITNRFSDSYELASYKENGNRGTALGFYLIEEKNDKGRRIDHIFLTPKTFSVSKYSIDTTTYVNRKGKRRYPSDHLPVVVELSLFML